MSEPFKPYLPGVLALIADKVGLITAVRLCEARGGREVHIPASPTETSSLTQIVGLDEARKIAKILGKGNVIIPKGNFGGTAGRRQRIANLLDQNLSHSAIAAEVDVHVRTVERVAEELRDARPSDLFSDHSKD